MPKQKLLLADDSITIQKVVNLTFADEGIEVISVGDGNSAMEKFIESVPDLVMVDVNMPGLDGYRICEMIKQDEDTKHVPVILLVGSFEPFDEDEARRVGANDYLTKPFQSIRQLVSKVSVLLSKSNGVEPAVQTPEVSPQQEVQQMKQAGSISESFGDVAMDDEMIQTNQVGSLPSDEFRKFETAELDEEHDQSKDFNFSSEPVDEVNVDHSKTQPFTADEYNEISSSIPENVKYEPIEKYYSDEAEGDRVNSLEQQMVSEFETDSKDTSSEFEIQPPEFQSDETVAEVEFRTEPNAEEVFAEPGEEPAEAGFVVTEDKSNIEGESVELANADELTEVADGDWEIYTPAANTEIPEPEEPYHYVEYIAEDEKPISEPEIEPEVENTDLSSGFEATKDLQDFEPIHDFAAAEADPIELETEIPTFEPVENVEKVSEQPLYFEDEKLINSADKVIEPSFIPSQPQEFDDSDDDINGAETISDYHPPKMEESATSTVEIPLPSETIEEEVSPIMDIPPTEFESAEAVPDSPAQSLVSNKDKNDAVENVIVSEFARHSISLSSEAVETIAARIAEKISEKIVQQLATDVVTDLADLIVDRMEQRKLK